MGRRILSLLLALTAGMGLAACGQTQSPAEGQETAAPEAQNSALLIAYAPETEGDPVAQAATLLAETLGGDVVEMGQEEDLTPSDYEFVLLGFAAADNALPAAVETFLDLFRDYNAFDNPQYYFRKSFHAANRAILRELGKLDKGENVTVYYVSDGWCFAKCGKQYGFLYDKYVSLAN